MSLLTLFQLNLESGDQTGTVNQAVETDQAQPIARLKRKAVGQVTETDLAQVLTRRKQRALGQVVEADLAQAMSREKQRLIGQAVETDTAVVMTLAGISVVDVVRLWKVSGSAPTIQKLTGD